MPAPFQKSNTAEPAVNPRQPRKASWRSLNWQLMFISILPVTALVLLVAIVSLSVHQDAMRNMVGERDIIAVRTAATAIEEQLAHRLYNVESLAVLAENVGADQFEQILAQPDYLQNIFDAGLAIYSSQGELVAASSGASHSVEFSERLPEAWQPQDSLSSSKSSVQIEKPSVTAQAILRFQSIAPSQEWSVVGFATVSKIIEKPLEQPFSDEHSAAILLIDPKHGLLYQYGALSSLNDISTLPGVGEALSGKSGVLYTQDKGNKLITAYSPVGSQGWALVFQEAWEMVESPTLRLSQLAPLILAPVLILAILALGFGARQIITPLQELESKASQLAWGDFEAIKTPVGGIDEIRQLQDELIRMAQKVRAAQKNLHSYIGAITSAQEDERLRLARELHDETIQALIALKQRVQLHQLSPTQSESEAATLSEIAALTEETIQNLRRLIHDLRPIYLEDLGLSTALEMLTREIAQTTNIRVAFTKHGKEKRLQGQFELALFRMTQEAFRNIERHAQASQANLIMKFEPQWLTIEISDNGIGFEAPRHPSEFSPSGHYGLLGLHERAELIGAALEIQSSPGKGTFLKFQVPLSSD